MTAWRVGVAIKPEQQFGVENENADWHYVGIGMDMNFTENNGWKFQNGMGSKTAQLEYEGRFSATWGGNLYLDYNNFYWLMFGLELYAFKKIGDYGYHIFSTANNKSIKSFSMRFLKLDREVGGPYDEEMIMLGCTMDKVSPSYESSGSAIKCAIGGKFADARLYADNLTDTIREGENLGKNKVTPINWGCLQVLNAQGTAWEKVANNERTGFTFSRTINTIPECGERIDNGYYESAINPIPITAVVYSRNANQWQTRMHSGGIRNDLSADGENNMSSPRKKGLQGIPNIRIASGSLTESEGESPAYSCIAQFEEAVVDNWGNTYNSGSEIVESPTIKATKGIILFKTPDITEALPGSDPADVVTVTYQFGLNTEPLVMYYPEGYSIKTLELPDEAGVIGWETNDNVRYLVGEDVVLTDDITFTPIEGVQEEQTLDLD